MSIVIGIAKVRADENSVIFMKFEGYALGQFLLTGWQASKLSDKNVISLEFFKIL